KGAVLGLALACLAAPALAQRNKVTIYTSLENDQLGPFKQAIEAAVPEAEVVWVRDSTGVITARFLAEKDNPRADMVLGHAATALLLFEKMGLLETYKPAGVDALKAAFKDTTLGLLETYKPAGVDALKAAFKDTTEPYTWTGMD